MMKKTFAWCKSSVKAFLDNNCTMHAAGLTYFAMLAMIPVLCCILVAAKTCHVDEYARSQINAQIDMMIVNIEKGQDDDLAQIAPQSEDQRQKRKIAAEEFAAQARRISNTLFERIDQFDVGTLGWIGFGFLLWTVISSLGMVEVSFNQIWGVAKPRPIWKRAYVYLFVMIVLPVLAAVAMSLPVLAAAKNAITATLGATWVTKWASDGLIVMINSTLFRLSVTLVFASLTFAFFFWLMPNCRVSFRRSWYGGVVTAVIFGAWMKVCAIAQVGIANSSALYGSFAFLPIVLAWLYMSWQIVLLGACMVKAFEDAK